MQCGHEESPIPGPTGPQLMARRRLERANNLARFDPFSARNAHGIDAVSVVQGIADQQRRHAAEAVRHEERCSLRERYEFITDINKPQSELCQEKITTIPT